MRRAHRAHLTSLAIGCVLFAACGDSTSPPVPRKSLAADAQAPNATTSWVNNGGANCLAVTSQDSTTFPPLDSFGYTGWYFCPSQTSASLYLAKDPLNPGYSLNLGGISVLLGPEMPTSYNPDGSVATFTRTDSLTCDNGGTVAPIWTGPTTQNFVRSTYRCCSRYFCRTCTRITNAGGTGTLTANQPAPPPPPPPAPVAAVVVSPESVSVMEQQVVWLTATPLDSVGNPTDQPVTWATSDSTVATVSQDGMVTGVARGQVTITATSQGQSGAATVTVTPEVDGPENVRAAVAATLRLRL
jgi:hypothetical protein